MNVARVSANGQITVPVEIRRALRLKKGDKIIFMRNDNGEIIVSNTSSVALHDNESKEGMLNAAIEKLNRAMQDDWEKVGIYSEEDLLAFVKKVRWEYYSNKNEL